MARLIILLTLIVLAYLIIRNLLKRPADTASSKTAKMVKCAYCNVYLPESESISAEQQFYCCEAHRNLAEKAR